MRTSVGLCILLSLAASVHGAAGELRPVEFQPGQALRQQGLNAYGQRFAKRTAGDGTVNEHAMVAVVRSGEPAMRVAVDAKSPDAKAPDVVRLDLAGKGRFDDETVVPLAGTQQGTTFHGQVGPATIRVRIGGRTIPVRVTGSYYRSNTYRHLALMLGTAAEGDCRFGGKTRRVRIVDGDSNLRIGDPATRTKSGSRVVGLGAGDTLVIDQGDGTFGGSVLRTYLGSPVLMDGVWYEVTVTGGGTKVAAKPLALKTGRIRVPHEQWSATFIGEKSFLTVTGGKGPVSLPADRYIITDYRETVEVGDGKMATLSRSGRREAYAGKARVFDVPADKTTDIAVGSPLSAGLAISKPGGIFSARQVRIDLELTDSSGAAIGGLTVPGVGRPACPTVSVFDAKGSPVYNCKLEYG